MKTIFVVLALISAVTAEDWAPKKLDEIKVIRSECLAANPLSADVLAKMKTFEYPDEEPVRHYLVCCVKKLGVFCEDNGYNAERVVMQFKLNMDKTEATEIVEKCIDKNEQKSSADVWAYRGHMCLVSSKIGEGIKDFVRKAAEEQKA